ncbi:9.5 kDa protein [Cordyline virus 3]|uniref:9.5 kDa protein n=1 Tax=Cordyline virus 3 TaxID=1177752 RepID=L7P044_9CLOS|nr:9.5 kDa protein [Cordyline virus 3]AFJ05059.2 9.5 kDa protein [Cordyline virus 3]
MEDLKNLLQSFNTSLKDFETPQEDITLFVKNIHQRMLQTMYLSNNRSFKGKFLILSVNEDIDLFYYLLEQFPFKKSEWT